MSPKRSGITRRQFLQGSAATAASLALMGSRAWRAPAAGNSSPPNLLFIQTDQQHFQAVSAFGNKHLKTPNMDRLVRRGISFSNSYSANPVCCPARSCWYTGRASTENGMLSNSHKLAENVPDLGQWLGSRGYFTAYTGKWHVPGRNANLSFSNLFIDPSGQGEEADPVVSRSAQSFLGSYADDKPFFLSVGFTQPHDCCYWRFAHDFDTQKVPYPVIEKDLPPLPGNFHYSTVEPVKMREHLERVRRREAPGWSELAWRYYIWSYYRHVEMADAEIGRVLDALEDSKFAQNTLLVFTVDHGDGMGFHRSTSKWFPYDEAIRVPFIICRPGAERDGRIDKTRLVSGLDLTPTLCDYAGVEPPPNVRGRSLRPLVEGKPVDWREFIVSDCQINGRMVRTPEYKLISYSGDSQELLFDMRKDPLELKDLSSDQSHAGVVTDLRSRLADWESRLISAA